MQCTLQYVPVQQRLSQKAPSLTCYRYGIIAYTLQYCTTSSAYGTLYPISLFISLAVSFSALICSPTLIYSIAVVVVVVH